MTETNQAIELFKKLPPDVQNAILYVAVGMKLAQTEQQSQKTA